MGKINLLIANAGDKFTESETSILQQATASAESFISDNFNFDYEIDVVVTGPSLLMSTIPEDGITGRTYNSRLIIIVLDKQQAEINEDIVFETICHEMAHSLRWEKLDEYSSTMFEGMILEGLAVVLEEKAMTDMNRARKQFFFDTMVNTDQALIENMISQLRDNFGSESYDYDRVFYSGDDKLPRWAGYRLGYYFVKKHLEQTGTTINHATLASYSIFKS